MNKKQFISVKFLKNHELVLRFCYFCGMNGRGKLIIIGGAVDKGSFTEASFDQDVSKNMNFFETGILKRIIDESKFKDKSRIEVITTASKIPREVGPEYVRAFQYLNASNVDVLHIERREQASEVDVIERLKAADVVMFTGGDQLRLSSILGGTKFHDILLEKSPDVANLIDLKFGYCRMSVAVPADSPYQSPLDIPHHGKVASKFVNCAKDYFRRLDIPVEIIPLYGSVELGPITGMSEAIVDLVSTGRTLRENGLVEIDELFASSARLIAHPLSYRLNRDQIYNWVEKLREATTSMAKV